jgi:peptidyl-prolyl cis-trans isomerase SurA
MHRDVPRLACAATLALLAGCTKSTPANVAATVNGRPITYADLDKQARIQAGGQPADKANDDQATLQRLELLRNMVDSEIMRQRAEKANLLATEADVDAKLTELKSPYTQEEFQKQLNLRNMTVDDLKEQLRREISVQKLINKEITSNINISDADVTQFYKENAASFNLKEPQIRLAQILVTAKPDPNVRNLKNDKAKTLAEAQKKIESLLARIRQGEEFGALASNYSEDPQSAPNGGEMGFIPESSLEKTSPELRKAILNTPAGQVSNVIQTEEGYRILKVISKEPAGQRDLNDPRVQQTIRETLLNRKDQLLKAAYFETARDEAKVVNYYAMSIVPGQEKSKNKKK